MIAHRRAWILPLFALLLALAPLARAQDSEGQPEAGGAERVVEADSRYATAWKTMETYLDAMRRYVTTQETSALDDAAACCEFEDDARATLRHELATDLYNILNRIEEVQEWHFQLEETDTRYVYFPADYPQDRAREHARLAQLIPGFRIELVKGAAGEWRFSADTMRLVGEHLREWEKLNIRAGVDHDISATLGQRLRHMAPEALRGSLLTLEYWQWLVILLVIIAGLVLDLLVRGVLKLFWRRVERRRGQKTDRGVLRRAVRPFGLLAAGLLWYSMLNVGGLSPFAYNVLTTAVKVIMSVASMWAAWRLVDLLADLFASKAAKTDTKIDDLLVPLIERTVKIFVVAIGLIYTAEAFRLPILPLLSGLGIGGLAVAFAAKDTIENFFGSVAVILDRPFEVGDWIVTGDVEGTVEWMGFRSTRVRTFYNSVVTVPNASLVRATVDNYGRRSYRRFKTTLNLSYATSPDKIEAFCEGVREIVRQHPYTRKDYYHVWLNEFGAHSLDVLVYVFFEAPDWSVELRERQRFMLDVIRLADRLGVEFAFPTQTLHLFKEEHGAQHEPAPTPEREAEMNAIREGVRQAREITAKAPWHEIRPGGVVFGSSGVPTGSSPVHGPTHEDDGDPR